MSPDKAWLVGILEGEGNFYLGQSHLRVKLSMSDLDVVERAAQLMGVKRVRGYMPSVLREKRDRSKMYEASVTGHEAARLMIHLRPHMGLRRQTKIDHCLTNWAPKISGKGFCRECATVWQEMRLASET